MSQLRLHLLGSPRLELDDVSITINRRKVLALLVYLATTKRLHRRDHLAALFWPGYDQSAARGNLRRTLSILNRTLDQNWLQIEQEQVRLKRGDNFWLDVDQFHQHLSRCTTHNHPASQVCAACLEPLSQAVGLYRDDFLTGFSLPDSPEFDDWQLFQTESLRRELVEALEKLGRGHGAQGEFERAIGFARRWLALQPLDEAAQRQVMRLLALRGERSAALAQYERGRQILADKLGVAPTAETTALYDQIREGEPVVAEFDLAVQPPGPPAPRHNLPAQLTPFIGRSDEVTKLNSLICEEPTCRLLTLVGSGGIGKTRLAVQAATEAIEAFPNGAVFVSLASVSATESLIPAIANALNLSLSSDRPQAQLLDYLREKEMLLLLDNFEQLIPTGGPDLLPEIIRTAPGVKLLVTSRERLNLQAEWGVEIRGLPVPEVDQEDLKAVEGYDAVQLFLQQARRAKPGFALSSENSPDIGRICRLVEGMPLGLELAAAWLRMMTCREIVREMERSLDFLTTPLRDVPDRHQSLRAVFEPSWQLMVEEEQAVFKKLSLFRGGFRRRAAERVAGASLPLLSALVDKSLLRRTRTGRYEIHELLRQFAAEKLGECPDEVDQVQDRHADYYLTFLHQRTDHLKGERQKETLDEITAEIDNIRAAWRRAIDQRNMAALDKSQESLFHFYEYRGWYQEGKTTFEQAVERLRDEDETVVQAQLLRGLGWFQSRLGRKQGIALIKQSLSLLRQVEPGLREGIALTAMVLGWATHIWTELEEAEQYLKESLAIYTEVGDLWGIGSALIDLGHLPYYKGEYTAAEQLLQRSVSVLGQIGETVDLANALRGQGEIVQLRGDYEQAERCLSRALRISREFKDSFPIIIVLRALGYLHIATGSYWQAQKYLQEGVDICREIGDRRILVTCLDRLGTVTRLQGDYQQAERRHRECLAVAREIDYQSSIAMSFKSLGRLAYDQREYRQAERHLREALAIWKGLGIQVEIAATMCHLGHVVCAMGGDKNDEARQHLQQSLEIAMTIGARPVALNALVGWAMWLSAGESENAAPERAIELLALVLHHPASEQETKDRATRLLAELESSLPPESIVAAQERARVRSLDAVAEEILNDKSLR